MKILIYGAGVIGSIYAARLHEAGCDVTLLARNKRYEDLKQNGIVLKNILTGKQSVIHVPLTSQLSTADFYDLIIVTVRLDQIDAVIPVLKANVVCPLVMFMFNNPVSVTQLASELSPKQIILGFPGVGGTIQDNRIEYIQIKQQKTTIGGLNGKTSGTLKEIKKLIEKGGFEVEVIKHMEDWLKIHAVFVACVSAAIAKENGDSVQLGKKRNSVRLMVKSIREGFIACKKLGMIIVPANLKIIFLLMPQWFSILYWQKAMQGEIGTLSIAPHANKAKGEMQLLAEKVLAIVHSSSYPAPTLDKLLGSFINLKSNSNPPIS